MIFANQVNSVGLTLTLTSQGGKLSQKINHAYMTPYQIKFAGTILKTGLSTTYDSGASATYEVAVPCGASDRPEGYSHITTAITNQLPGATVAYNPLTEDLTGGSSEYADDEAKFVPVTLNPFTPGEPVAFPLAASQTIAVGDIIVTAADGLVRKGNSVSSVWAVGKAMVAVTSAATVTPTTVKFVPVRTDVYYKSS